MDIVLIACNPSFSILELFIYVQEILDSLEFARGSVNSTWGSVRAKMGHPKPFPVKYVAIGNEDCERKFYKGTLMDYFFISSILQYKLNYREGNIVGRCYE
jgi:alpha-N-arabinofuranosidase